MKNKLIVLILSVASIITANYNILLSQNNQTIDNVLAVVGSNIILLSDVENQYYQLSPSEKESYKDIDIKCEIFENLLMQKILLNQAQLDSIEVSNKEVEQELERRIRYFVSKAGTEKALEDYFNKPIAEIRIDLKKTLKDQMLVERMQNKLTGDIKIIPTEVQQFFKSIPKDSIPTINTQTEFEQIVMYPKISSAQTLEVKAKLQEIRDRIIAGEKFSTLAVLYSEDKGSFAQGGELGFVGRTELVPEFASVAFTLKEGEVSKIVETSFGFHIIQLIERRGEQINVRHILLMPKISYEETNKTRKTLDSLNRAIKSGNILFKDAVEKYSQDALSKNNNGIMVNSYTGSTKFEEEDIDPAVKYNTADLNIGDISPVFETNELNKVAYKIVRIKSKTNAHKANLKDDYQTIQTIALQNKKQKTTEDWLKEKQKSLYIHIDDSYKNCSFHSKGWIK